MLKGPGDLIVDPGVEFRLANGFAGRPDRFTCRGRRDVPVKE